MASDKAVQEVEAWARKSAAQAMAMRLDVQQVVRETLGQEEMQELIDNVALALTRAHAAGVAEGLEKRKAIVDEVALALRFMRDRVVTATWPSEEQRGATITAAIKCADAALSRLDAAKEGT